MFNCNTGGGAAGLSRIVRAVIKREARWYAARLSILGLIAVVLSTGHKVAIQEHLGSIPILLPFWWAYVGTALTVAGMIVSGLDGTVGMFGDPLPLILYLLPVAGAAWLIGVATDPVITIHLARLF